MRQIFPSTRLLDHKLNVDLPRSLPAVITPVTCTSRLLNNLVNNRRGVRPTGYRSRLYIGARWTRAAKQTTSHQSSSCASSHVHSCCHMRRLMTPPVRHLIVSPAIWRRSFRAYLLPVFRTGISGEGGCEDLIPWWLAYTYLQWYISYNRARSYWSITFLLNCPQVAPIPIYSVGCWYSLDNFTNRDQEGVVADDVDLILGSGLELHVYIWIQPNEN
jgi:hypothetical protein